MSHPINVASELKIFCLIRESQSLEEEKTGSLKGYLVPSALYKTIYVIQYLSNF